MVLAEFINCGISVQWTTTQKEAKGHTLDTYNMDGSLRTYMAQKKPDIKTYVLYNFSYTTLKKKIESVLTETNQSLSGVGVGRESIGKGPEGIFWGDGNVLCLYLACWLHVYLYLPN